MADVIDLGALAEVVAVAFLGGVGLVVLFSLATVGVDLARDNDGGRRRRPLGLLLAGVGFAAIAVALVVGLYVLLRK